MMSKEKGNILKNPHFWGITVLTVFLAAVYYSDQIGIADWIPFGRHFFTVDYLRDLHRALFLIPMLYCAVMFQRRGAVVISAIILCLLLPRGILISPNPDPVLRAVVFHIIASLATVLLAWERQRRASEEKAWDGLELAHQELESHASNLKASEERYRALFDNTKDGIYTRDLEGNVIMANPAMATITGYAVNELEKMNVSQFLTPSSIETVMERQKSLLDSSGETVSDRYEVRVVHKDGTERIIEVVTGLLISEDQPVVAQTICRDITEQKRLQENMQFYVSEITKAQEEERKRIARELHDGTAQALARLGFDIDLLLQTKQKLSDEAKGHLEDLRSRVDEAMEEVRRFSHELRPAILDALGLVDALRWLTDDLSPEQGIDVSLELEGTLRRLSPEAELVLFRIAQEALSNVRKYSKATKAVVRVEFGAGKVKLSVSDNGQGFELPKEIGEFVHSGKLGLIGVQERTRLLDGSLKIQSEPGRGTTVEVWVDA